MTNFKNFMKRRNGENFVVIGKKTGKRLKKPK